MLGMPVFTEGGLRDRGRRNVSLAGALHDFGDVERSFGGGGNGLRAEYSQIQHSCHAHPLFLEFSCLCELKAKGAESLREKKELLGGEEGRRGEVIWAGNCS